MKQVAAVGAELRLQAARAGVGRDGPYEQEVGEVVLIHFLDKDVGLFSAHIGARFSPEEEALPQMEHALEAFPVDGKGLEVSKGLVYPRNSGTGARGHRLKPAHLWVPSRNQSESQAVFEGWACGWGCTVECGRRGDWFLVPYLTVRVETRNGPRNVHARLFPPNSAQCAVNMGELLRKDGGRGELPEFFDTLHSQWAKTHLWGLVQIRAQGRAFLLDHFCVEEAVPAGEFQEALQEALA